MFAGQVNALLSELDALKRLLSSEDVAACNSTIPRLNITFLGHSHCYWSNYVIMFNETWLSPGDCVALNETSTPGEETILNVPHTLLGTFTHLNHLVLY